MRAAADDSFAVGPVALGDRLRSGVDAVATKLWGITAFIGVGSDRRRRLGAALLAAGAVLAAIVPTVSGGAASATGLRALVSPAQPAHATIASSDQGDAVLVALPGGTIPIGKGMWINHLSRTAGGDPTRIVTQARLAGLTHLYLRVGSSVDGFYAGADLERLLPAAHAAGIKVIGWDFVYLGDPIGDAARGRIEAAYTTAGGDRLDGLAPDIETEREGVHLSPGSARLFGDRLRQAVGSRYPLIAVVPRPNPRLTSYPFADVLASFDAVAPMVYWGHQDPASTVTAAIAALAPFGKPVIPVGQAYDPAIDGGAPGAPTKADIAAFVGAASQAGALGVSFWVWETANADHWAGIGDSQQVTLDPGAVDHDDPASVTYLQHVLTGLGHVTPVTGSGGSAMTSALAELQRQGGVQATGKLDGPTLRLLLAPTRG
jgi:hypothetical protein